MLQELHAQQLAGFFLYNLVAFVDKKSLLKLQNTGPLISMLLKVKSCYIVMCLVLQELLTKFACTDPYCPEFCTCSERLTIVVNIIIIWQTQSLANPCALIGSFSVRILQSGPFPWKWSNPCIFVLQRSWQIQNLQPKQRKTTRRS